MLNSKKEIAHWLDKMRIRRYTINDDLSVDVKGSVGISDKNLKSIPVQFGRVGGNFWCYNNNLTSLKGCPKYVYGTFNCSDNKLTSLEQCLARVNGNFLCQRNKLASLQQGPTYIDGNFICDQNNLTSLKDIHKQIKQININLTVVDNPIKSHILGVFFIKGLQEIQLSDKNVTFILNKHLKGDRDVHKCQEELIKAGFTEYAKL